MGITAWQSSEIKLQQTCTWLSLIHSEYLQNWLIFRNMIFPPQKCQNINTENFFSEWPSGLLLKITLVRLLTTGNPYEGLVSFLSS